MDAQIPQSNPTLRSEAHELVVTRIFDALRELVFKAWIDPKHVAQWGPEVAVALAGNAPRELVFRAYTEPTLISKWWGDVALRPRLTRWR